MKSTTHAPIVNWGLIFAIVSLIVLPLLGAVYGREPQLPEAGIPPVEETDTPVPTATRTKTVRPTRTPTATLTPCPLQMQAGQVTLIFDGVASAECARIFQLVNDTQYWFAEQELPMGSATVYVFGDLKGVATFEYEKFQRGNGMSYEDVEKSWVNGSGARSYPGAAILYTGGKWWRTVGDRETAKAVVHEAVHLEQYWLYGEGKKYFRNVPLWYSEGHAEYMARMLLRLWAIEPINVTGTLNGECASSFGLDVRGNCLFVQGEQMFILLELSYGQMSFDVWERLGQGTAFAAAFKDVYGVSVAEFGTMFDAFHKNNYRLIVPTATPTP